MKEYAVYKGEEILGIGTVDELAKKLNVKRKTIFFWGTPSGHKRNKGKAKIAIRIEED